MGAKRDAVRAAQVALSAEGSVLVVDGKWGPKTQAAFDRASVSTQQTVKAVLAKAGLTPEAISAYQRSGGDENKQVFVTQVLPTVKKLAAERGLNGDLMAAQLYHESGGGGHIPKGSNNWGGIKASQGQPSVMAQTSEVFGGKAVRVQQPFRVFNTPDDFSRYYVEKLATMPRYQAAYKEKDTAKAIQLLAASGYATDPAYAKGLRRALPSVTLA